MVVSPRTRSLVVAVMLATVAAALVLAATARYGLGLTADSAKYLSAARNFAASGSLTLYDGSPLLTQPPLYPILLGFLQWVTGIDAFAVARLLNAILLTGIVLLSASLLLPSLRSNPTLKVLGALALALALPLFYTSLMLWSEALFVLLIVAFLKSLMVYLEGGRWPWLALTTVAVALACLTRYIGVALLATGVLAILVWREAPVAKRVRDALILAVGAALPLGAVGHPQPCGIGNLVRATHPAQ